MFTTRRRARGVARRATPLPTRTSSRTPAAAAPLLAALSLGVAVAISPVGAQPATTSHAGASAVRHVTLLVTDAATGLPLDAVRASLDGATVSPALGDGRGHVTVAVTPVRHDAAVVVRRLGYAPRTVSLDAIAAHAAMHPGAPFPIALDARPALLNTVSVEEARPNQLAAGTALAVGTVDGAAVAEAGATSLAEALDALEGVTVGRVGAWGSKASIRGLGGERLAVMIDGARVGRACAFGMDQGLATLDPAVVERVELLAGPGSTLYGSGNIGGVLNVVTRNPALAAPDGRVGGELRLGASTAVPGGTLGGGVWTRRGRLDVALQLDAQRYGDYRTPTAAVAGSSFRAATGDLKVGWALTGAQRIALQLTDYQARDIGWPTMTGGSIPKEGRRAAALDWGWQRGHGLVDAASASVFAQRLDHHMLMDMVMPMSMGGMGSMGGTSGTGGMGGIGGGTSSAATMRSTTDARSHSTTSGARAQLRLRPGARTHVDAGVEATQWAAEGTRWSTTTTTGSHGGGSGAGGMGGMSETSGMSMPTASKTTATHTWPGVRILDLGLFAQGEHQATDRLTLSGGARVDRIAKRATGWVSDVQTLGTGNLGARLALGGGLAARASAGMGYRTPDPTELFGVVARPDGFVYRGNPALDTETGRTVEAGLAWDGAWHALAVHEA